MADRPMQYKVCFGIDKERDTKVKALPRSFNLSERLRGCLDKILAEQSKEDNKSGGHNNDYE